MLKYMEIIFVQKKKKYFYILYPTPLYVIYSVVKIIVSKIKTLLIIHTVQSIKNILKVSPLT